MSSYFEYPITMELFEWAKAGRLSMEIHYYDDSEAQFMGVIRLDNEPIFVNYYDYDADEHVGYHSVSHFGKYDEHEILHAMVEFNNELMTDEWEKGHDGFKPKPEPYSDEMQTILNTCSYFCSNDNEIIPRCFASFWDMPFNYQTNTYGILTNINEHEIGFKDEDNNETILVREPTHRISEELFRKKCQARKPMCSV